ncbi:cobyrinate a,c-diamide synthase [Allosphingosinicella deserti]|uniref:Cobyrinate a,c-diamide synthase n=1 Tax=Allosphingosinicella deserti TaxID=2116704 RepID=A0A2P7QJZ7_9SPHN|nr:cobyrinate a,c-diamide synthase [Sphingomonas deserti]PSJ38315.1 cobyrinic acid a,c-diamide synthase [Sphingomonas deserti]
MNVAPALGRGLIVAAPRSGSGKTILTIGLQRAFAHRGRVVHGAKSGPDYIDPAFHAVATGRQSINLDGFAMTPDLLRGLGAGIASGADLVIGEGAMGLYDGARAEGRSGASADVANALGWPVLLVIDASGAAQTIAAVAHGCATFPGAPRIAGIIANRVASARHKSMIEDGLARIGLPLLGALAPDERFSLPSRHLGLVQAGEQADLDARIDVVAERIAAQCDLDAIFAAAGATATAPLPAARLRPPGQRIAVARDEAFAFFYPHMLRWWRDGGAEIRFFSPLADEAPDAECDSCWLPGGYPELHAGRLAANRRFLDGLTRFSATRPVHGECGGYMVLGRSLEDADGVHHEMAGLLPVDTSFATRKLSLGYRRAVLRRDTTFAEAGRTLFGHEYHYATERAADGDAEPFADIADAAGTALGAAGHRVGLVTGSFFHLIA